MTIETMTPKEAADQLKALGMRVTEVTIREGIKQGVYPFGVCIQMERQPVYQIFKRLFDEWVSERVKEKPPLPVTNRQRGSQGVELETSTSSL